MSCPICKAETVKAHRPFCSRRCADIDLGRWFNGSSAVPSRDPDDVEAANVAAEAVQDSPVKPH